MPQRGLKGRLAISRRYTSGDKSAWKADFHPDVIRQENQKVPQRVENGEQTTGKGPQRPRRGQQRSAEASRDQQRPQTNSQGLRRDRQKTSRGQQRPTDRREDGLVLLRKKFEVQQALFEVGAADADADFVTEAVDLVGAAAAQAVFLLFKLEEIRLYVTE